MLIYMHQYLTDLRPCGCLPLPSPLVFIHFLADMLNLHSQCAHDRSSSISALVNILELNLVKSSPAFLQVALLLRCIIHLHQQRPNPKIYKLSCAAFLISLSKKKKEKEENCPLWDSVCDQTWQLITVKLRTKKVAITHSAGGPPEITIIPNRHLRQEPWLSKRGQ